MCGGVNTTMKGSEVSEQISGLFQYIRPAAKVAKGDSEQSNLGKRMEPRSLARESASGDFENGSAKRTCHGRRDL